MASPPLFLATIDVDAVALEQRAVLRLAERSARGEVDRVRHGERRIDGIDAADQIGVLRRVGEGLDLVAAEREKHAPRRFAQRGHCCGDTVDLDPLIAGHLLPGARRSASSWTPVRAAARAALAEMTAA